MEGGASREADNMNYLWEAWEGPPEHVGRRATHLQLSSGGG